MTGFDAWDANVQAFAVAMIRSTASGSPGRLDVKAVALQAMRIADEIERGRSARIGKPPAEWGMEPPR